MCLQGSGLVYIKPEAYSLGLYTVPCSGDVMVHGGTQLWDVS